MVRQGTDLTLFSLGVGVHRCLEAANVLSGKGLEATVVDLRSVAPLDRHTVLTAAAKTGRVVVVDEDYLSCGLSGEIAAVPAEAGVPIRFRRVATDQTIPYARHLEDRVLPNLQRILDAATQLVAI